MAVKDNTPKRATRRRPAAKQKSERSSAPVTADERSNFSSDTTPTKGEPFVVGIGASAGGLAALEAFFGAMPQDSGMAFVVVTHHPPQQRTLLPELLARRTQMPTEVAGDGTRVEANHVYVSPPGCNLAILNGVLQVTAVAPGEHVHLPIDYFFRTLAEDQRQRVICIVLSGTGSDGTLGLQAIKAHSGLAIVQDEASAHYAGMPHSAAATLLADYLLRPDEMPGQLLSYVRTSGMLGPAPGVADPELRQALPKIFLLLRGRVGHDFSGYKRNTMERRVERRMKVHGIARPASYVHLLQTQPHELDLLFHELLITVTQFFRDPPAFDALAKQLSARLSDQPEPASLRVWVPGCATGEEAYSIAMVVLDLAAQAEKRLRLQIFATDLDAQAIEVARAGLYAQGIVADVGPERLRRFFVAESKGYRIHKRVRDCVVFATQNVLTDPPFTKLDLLYCRNLLIYLNAALQEQLFPLFHYALNPGGLLWFGTSETLTGCDELFSIVDRKWKIYARKATAVGSTRGIAVRRPDFNVTMPTLAGRKRQASDGLGALATLVEALILKRFGPATVIVNERGDIVYIHGRTGRFLEPSSGEPRHNLFAMAREGLKLGLQSAMHAAALRDHEVMHRGIQVEINGSIKAVTVIVGHIAEPEPLRGLYRVSFVVTGRAARRTHTAPQGPQGVEHREPAKTRYGRALLHTRNSLQATLDELQTSNEELTSANEELQSTNEELQSTNEELETSKEETQSLNEELQTVNAELQSKVEQLAQVNDDMHNLLNSTDIATLFLDRELRIKRFTEQARSVVRLIATDVGRPIGDLVTQVRYANLTEDAHAVLQTLRPHETEVPSLDGRWLLVRILPYRTAQNVIDGVVVTFIDITRSKHAEQKAASSALADRIVQTVHDPLLVLDGALRIVSTNRASSRLLGLEPNELLDQCFLELPGGTFHAPHLRTLLERVVADGRPVEDFELSYESPSATARRMLLTARRLEDSDAKTALVLVVLTDRPANVDPSTP